ncbi:adrenodoxin, putative [Bodo saltans]|uniref:Adrenodoxin, putative n=1 Tax=Bodo saltans TaxID=75058 RepID=A0A0S4J024_BODSA|nr:adrenodoxin, putative [Bodo saltans]|eukprot:CUG39823.1 adrenodoxin, putative [Bodo saltans]
MQRMMLNSCRRWGMSMTPSAVFVTSSRFASTTTTTPPSSAAGTTMKVKVTFITQDGTKVPISVPVGMTLMEAARDIAKIDVEAACDGTCACSTCHMYLSEAHFKTLGDPSEDELDMLDLAPAPKPTSRLSCQVQITKEMDGLEATLPKETSNQLS